MRKPFAGLWKVPAAALLVAASACWAKPNIQEDPPPIAAARPGDVSGTIAPAAEVASLQAVSRVTKKTYQPASFDKTTGRFVFKALPGAATYDICVTTTSGREIQGIDMDFVDARMIELAQARRKQLGLAEPAAHSFDQQDASALKDWVKDLKDFMELRRVLYIQGHGATATMLVELMRSREFYESGDQIIWRVELWYFEYQHGGWERLPNQERVLRRERIDPKAWKKIDVEYFPQLSVYVDADGVSRNVDFKIPAKPDPSTGRPAGTSPDLECKTHVLGLDEPAATPTSQPGAATSRPAN